MGAKFSDARKQALSAAFRAKYLKTRDERFWAKVNKDGPVLREELGPCWVWTASKRHHGYGNLGLDGKVVAAHRVSWEWANGPIPEGLMVCHRCDNPPCVRPDYLFLGTNTDNQQDAKRKGRSRGGAHKLQKLSVEDVGEVLATLAKGGRFATRKAATAFGVAIETIEEIVRGKKYRREVAAWCCVG